jgi:hypothetical protein
MQTPVTNSQAAPAFAGRHESTSGILFAVGVVLLICGGAITGNHHWNMIGLALIVFGSLVDLD